jgi:hypothetical protein
MRRAPFLVASLVVAALGAAGCGQSDDRATVRAATQRFLSAYKADEGETACAALSQDTRKELEREESQPCPEAISGVKIDGGAITKVHVQLTSAKVDLATGESVFLSQQQAGWRITALGCRSAGSPTTTPFDCELEA